MVPTLETRRLVLRPITLSDIPNYQRLFADYDVIRFLDGNVVPWPYPEDGVATYLATALPDVEAGKMIKWAICEKEAPELLIGNLTMTPNSEHDHRGFWLGKPYWGRGYMSEVVAVTTDYAFDELKMPLLRVSNAVLNIGSHRLKEKAGAVIVKADTEKYYAGGETCISETWELTPEAWRANRHKFFTD